MTQVKNPTEQDVDSIFFSIQNFFFFIIFNTFTILPSAEM